MGIVKKQGSLSTAIIYLGAILGYINVALLLPKYLTQEEMGLRALLVDFATIFSQIVLVGFPFVYMRYFPQFKQEDGKLKGLFLFVFSVPMIVFLVFFSALFLNEKQFLDWYLKDSLILKENFYLVYFLCFFFVLNALLETYCRTFFKIVLPNFLREIGLRINALVVVYLYVTHIITIEVFFQLFTFSYFLNSTILVFYIFKNGQLDFSIDKRFYEKSFLKEVFTFAFFTSATAVSGMLMTKIDNLMLGNMLGLKEVGIYSLAVFIVAVIEFPRRAFTMINIPLFTQYWKENDMKSIQDLYQKTGEVLTIIGLFVYGGIVININEVFEIIPKGETYAAGKYVVIVLGFSKIFDMVFSNNSELLFPTKYYRNILYFILLLMVLAVSTNYFFIQKIGITGAALGTLISLLVYNVAVCLFIYFKWKLLPFTKNSIISLLMYLVLILFLYQVDFNINSFVDIALRSVVFSVIVFLSVYYTNISPDIKNMLKKLLSKIF